MMNEKVIGMFDIYVYDQDSGECIGVDPAYDQYNYRGGAQAWNLKGHPVKVVDTVDGAVVYTLDW